MFYWLFKNGNLEAPLVLWINGGPGSTSILGLFLELGPLRVSLTDSKNLEVIFVNDSWLNEAYLIFYDCLLEQDLVMNENI